MQMPTHSYDPQGISRGSVECRSKPQKHADLGADLLDHDVNGNQDVLMTAQ